MVRGSGEPTSEWRELTWDDATQWGYEALVGGEALYEEIDAEQGRSTSIESTCGALTRSSAKRTPGCHGAGAGLATSRLRQSGALSTAPALPTQTGTDHGLVPGARR
jgi:hypothetical protein